MVTGQRQTIISLVGVPGSGKSALLDALVAGRDDLMGCDCLRRAAREGVASFGESTRAYLVRDGGKHQKKEAWATIEEAIGDCGYLVNDNVVTLEVLKDFDHSRFQLVTVCLLASDWLCAARLRVRYQHAPDTKEQKWVTEQAPSQEYLLHYLIDFNSNHPDADHQTVLLDTNDWPHSEVSGERAWQIIHGEKVTPQFPEASQLYQRVVFVDGQPLNEAPEAAIQWERDRLDAILPKYLRGKTVLDIGAAEGGFCFEALHRGAALAVGLEEALPRVVLARQIRDAYELPASFTWGDGAQAIRPLNTHEGAVRFDVALLLNVLHHEHEDPSVMLQRVLAVCNECVIESPFGIGAVPYRPGLPPIEHSMALPPLWVERQAKAAGFRLTSIENSIMYEGQRLIYRLEREKL